MGQTILIVVCLDPVINSCRTTIGQDSDTPFALGPTCNSFQGGSIPRGVALLVTMLQQNANQKEAATADATLKPLGG